MLASLLNRHNRAYPAYAALPRPKGTLPVWGLEWWFAPRRFDRRITGAGARFVLEFPTMPPILFTTSPDDCKAIFKEKDGALLFGEGLRRFAPHEALFGAEFVEYTDGERHKAFRRDVSPPFHGDALKGYERGMVAITERRLEELPVGEPFRFDKFSHILARDVIMSTVFGVVDEGRSKRLERVLMQLDHVFNSLEIAGRFVAAMAMRGHWAPFPRLENLNAEIDAIVIEEIAARRSAGMPERDDCLALFLRIQADNSDGTMTDLMIARWMRLLLVAGWETTAVTLAWVVERLVRHPDVLARCEAEARAGQHELIDACVVEAMRLRPVLPLTVRWVAKDFDLNGLTVPSGTLLAIDIERLQRRADLYPEPNAFKPERFLKEKPGTYTWVPFGGGVHRCLGAQFALFEARVILRTLLAARKLRPESAPSEPLMKRNILSAPRHGARVTFERPLAAR